MFGLGRDGQALMLQQSVSGAITTGSGRHEIV
jgi:hypothetical protein